ncbi:apolipoprotein E-like [Phaenicophaeus curvirostris]|uniref:apolipoprotein E-like n=1 Tax=Phaenicophaeus curvirostris TaxID=33595 RepID=UPI0037F09744
MKLWVTLVAATLLAGCGAEPPPTPQVEPPPPAPHKGIWGVLEGGRGLNETLGSIRLWVRTLGTRLRLLGSALRDEVADVGHRALDYGADAKATVELGWAELRHRGASYGRKLRKRLHRDGEELRRRWQHLGRLWEGAHDLEDTPRPEGPQQEAGDVNEA